jgi:hypothetical protein
MFGDFEDWMSSSSTLAGPLMPRSISAIGTDNLQTLDTNALERGTDEHLNQRSGRPNTYIRMVMTMACLALVHIANHSRRIVDSSSR